MKTLDMVIEYDKKIKELTNISEVEINKLNSKQTASLAKLALFCTLIISQTLLIIAKKKG
jgi:hypothetical protein